MLITAQLVASRLGAFATLTEFFFLQHKLSFHQSCIIDDAEKRKKRSSHAKADLSQWNKFSCNVKGSLHSTIILNQNVSLVFIKFTYGLQKRI